MTNFKAQFVAGSAGDAGYLGASLSFLAADTRQGLSIAARRDFAAIKAHAAAHPESAVAAAYVTRLEGMLGKPAGRSPAAPTLAF